VKTLSSVWLRRRPRQSIEAGQPDRQAHVEARGGDGDVLFNYLPWPVFCDAVSTIVALAGPAHRINWLVLWQKPSELDSAFAS
jgi:hypothetical protein